MRKATVLIKGEAAGILTQLDNGNFQFEYFKQWVTDPVKPAISVTMPKQNELINSEFLFPVFFSLFPEAQNLKIIADVYKIDENDFFALLCKTAKFDSAGFITINEIRR